MGFVSDMSDKQDLKHLHESMIMFAFRYALTRATGAPLVVVNYILANKGSLRSQTKQDIVRDIEREKRMGRRITDDWGRLLEAFKDDN